MATRTKQDVIDQVTGWIGLHWHEPNAVLEIAIADGRVTLASRVTETADQAEPEDAEPEPRA